MKRLFLVWQNAGVRPEMPAREKKYVVMLNHASMIIAAVAVLAMLNAAFFGRGAMILHQAVQMAGCLLVPLLHRNGRYFAARLFFANFATVLLVIAVGLIGTEAHMQFFLLTVAGGALLLHPHAERQWGVLTAIIAFGAMLIVDSGVLGLPKVTSISADSIESARAFNHVLLAIVLGGFTFYAHRQTHIAEDSLDAALAQADRLLFNVLPASVADRLKRDPATIADRVDEATVLFADIVHFTELSERTTAPELVKLLDRVFTAFDRLADKHGLEKIKTIGDAYMVAAGIPEPRADHVEAVARMALDMHEAMRALSVPPYETLDLRIGIHTGPVVAGVIGQKRFAYDLWGDTVNTASRMESHGEAGRVHVSAAVRARLDGRFTFEPRGIIAVKGKGDMQTFFLVPPPRAG